MANRSNGFQAAIGMVIILLAVSIVVPSIFLATESPQTNVFEQEELERQTLTGEVSTEVTQITNQKETNLTILNRRDGTVDSTGLLQEGESTNLTVAGANIEVQIIDVIENNGVLVRYTYPLYIGWPEGAETIIKNIGEIIVISTMVMILGSIFMGYKVFAQ